MSDSLIPTPPPEAGWGVALITALIALGKPALDAWRTIRSKGEAHRQALELRSVTAREAEDRELITLLKDEIKTLREEIKELRSRQDHLSERNITLERENAVLRFQLQLKDAT